MVKNEKGRCITMIKEYKLTQKGKETFEKELDFLKTTKRDEIAEKIEIARSYGDLSENAEYDEAKNDQAKVENRILEIEHILKNAVIIEDIDTGKVRIGAKVTVTNLNTNTDYEYEIVGSNEADPLHGKLSDESPVGKALIDKEPGDIVHVETPSGKVVKYKVIDVSKIEEV